MTFKKGDIVRVINIYGWEIPGAGGIGIVVNILDGYWPIEVEHDYGTFAYKESELELVED